MQKKSQVTRPSGRLKRRIKVGGLSTRFEVSDLRDILLRDGVREAINFEINGDLQYTRVWRKFEKSLNKLWKVWEEV